MSLASWYNNQYAAWNRTRNLRVAPVLAREDTRTSVAAAQMNRTRAANGQDAVLINMADVATDVATAMNADPNKDKKKQTTLFGPNIGVVSTGPEWADLDEKSAVADELTQDVVEGWVAKSKDPSQPTTTLQALVNLKRPTLRLSPLDVSDADAEHDEQEHSHHDHHHGLEFEFDCDAPKCAIRVHVFLPASAKESATGMQRIDVFDQVVDGGFGRVLKLEDGAALELGKFERQVRAVAEAAASEEVAASSGETEPAAQANSTDAVPRHRKRFTMPFRRRTHTHTPSNGQITGPALAVVDAVGHTPAGSSTTNVANTKDGKKSDGDEEGARVAIRLAALDKEGKELSSQNVQTTYLQIVRVGAAPEAGEDTRPWVVKVVKREATIGPHTFSLHEIYGLASHTSAPTAPLAPTAPAPATAEHTYPPVTGTTVVPAPPAADDATSECILCLSSPREVVLLPCRHLVACRECAVNMVEFGAGGALVHTTDDAPDATAAANPNNPESNAEAGLGGGVDGTADGAPVPQTETPVAPNVNANRRKRKAKGWFCPICRQPYTSLLRITTTAPEKELDGARASTSTDGEPAAPVPVAPAHERSGGLLTRPSFLRGFSRSSARSTGAPDAAAVIPPVPSIPAAAAPAAPAAAPAEAEATPAELAPAGVTEPTEPTEPTADADAETTDAASEVVPVPDSEEAKAIETVEVPTSEESEPTAAPAPEAESNEVAVEHAPAPSSDVAA